MKRSAAVLLVAAGLATSCGHGSTRPTGGRFLVYTRNLESSKPALWIAHVDGTHPRLLVPGGLFGALSPDGRWVAYDRCVAARGRCRTGNAPFALFVVGTSGGRPRLLGRATTLEPLGA